MQSLLLLATAVAALRPQPTGSRTTTKLRAAAAPPDEIARRRNFAIISHPDAGKTTLTEKLLLYGDAIQQAGMVKARANGRDSTSDFLGERRLARVGVADDGEVAPSRDLVGRRRGRAELCGCARAARLRAQGRGSGKGKEQ